MENYIILNKDKTDLPMLIYLTTGDNFFPHIMFQNDYSETPNKDNLVKMNIDGSIDIGDKTLNIKQDDIEALIVLFEENERNIVYYWNKYIPREEFISKCSNFKHSKFIGNNHYPFTHPVYKILYQELKVQSDSIYVGNQYTDKDVFDYIIENCEKFVDNPEHIKLIKKHRPQSIDVLSIMAEHLCVSDIFSAQNQAKNKVMLQNILEKRLEGTHGVIADFEQLRDVIVIVCDYSERVASDALMNFLNNVQDNILKKRFYQQCYKKQLTEVETDNFWQLIIKTHKTLFLSPTERISYGKDIYRIAFIYKNFVKA